MDRVMDSKWQRAASREHCTAKCQKYSIAYSIQKIPNCHIHFFRHRGHVEPSSVWRNQRKSEPKASGRLQRVESTAFKSVRVFICQVSFRTSRKVWSRISTNVEKYPKCEHKAGKTGKHCNGSNIWRERKNMKERSRILKFIAIYWDETKANTNPAKSLLHVAPERKFSLHSFMFCCKFLICMATCPRSGKANFSWAFCRVLALEQKAASWVWLFAADHPQRQECFQKNHKDMFKNRTLLVYPKLKGSLHLQSRCQIHVGFQYFLNRSVPKHLSMLRCAIKYGQDDGTALSLSIMNVVVHMKTSKKELAKPPEHWTSWTTHNSRAFANANLEAMLSARIFIKLKRINQDQLQHQFGLKFHLPRKRMQPQGLLRLSVWNLIHPP